MRRLALALRFRLWHYLSGKRVIANGQQSKTERCRALRLAPTSARALRLMGAALKR